MADGNEDDRASKLLALCSSDDISGLRALYRNDPNIRSLVQPSQEGDTSDVAAKALCASALQCHYEVTKFLLNKGVSANAFTVDGPALCAAVKSGNVEMVKLLLSHGAEYRTKSSSPVYVACVEGKLNVLRYLFEIRVSFEEFEDDSSLLFAVCSAGQFNILQYLVEELQFSIHPASGGSEDVVADNLLYAACQGSALSVARYLVEQGAPITQTIASEFPDAVRTILREKIAVNQRCLGQQTVQAKLKDLGLDEVPWTVLADFANRLTTLELQSNFLISLPEEIFQLPVLKRLDVSKNRLVELCWKDATWSCYRLRELNSSYNKLRMIPTSLFHLPELVQVNVSHNFLTSIPGDPENTATSESGNSNWSCSKLRMLNLSHNQLQSLPDVFSSLHSLHSLLLAHNQLNELPLCCAHGCINLVELDISHNLLSDLPHEVVSSWMYSLEVLQLSHNRFFEITRNITELANLTTLDLSFNKIVNLPPTSSWSSNRMSSFNLSNNRLTSVTSTSQQDQWMVVEKQKNRKATPCVTPLPPSPEESSQGVPFALWASSLQSLYLNGNRLSCLPDCIGKLLALTTLDISGNTDIKNLPLTLGGLRNCTNISMNGLSICNVPRYLLPSMRGGSSEKMLAYLRTKLRRSIPYHRMKLMAVGLQGRGKSTLLSVLRNPSSSLPSNISTVGVKVAEWVMAPPRHILKEVKKGHTLKRHQNPITFSTWDLAGQEVYYATHQCFMTRNTLYMVVWSVEEGERGIDYLRPWLLNIQARAPHSPVLIVGTHLDKLPQATVAAQIQQFEDCLRSRYDKPGYPCLSGVLFVSCVTQQGIPELLERVHHVALSAVDPDTKERIIGAQAPASYLSLQNLIMKEVTTRRADGTPPVLSQHEFAALADRVPDSDIYDPEELSVAAQFLHNYGVLLHYNDHLRGLNNLYFIDPSWLADLLAEVITVPQRQNFVSGGILHQSTLSFIFRDSRRFPSQYFAQYLELFERFQIALSLGQGQWLIPPLLPLRPPENLSNFIGLPSSQNQSPKSVDVKEGDASRPTGNSSSKNDLSSATSTSSSSAGSEREWWRKIKKSSNSEVFDHPSNCVRRRYLMANTPSGFWSRLISRLINNLERAGLQLKSDFEASSTNHHLTNVVYWRRGVAVKHDGGRFIVRSIESCKKKGVAPTKTDTLQATERFFGEEVDLNIGVRGVDVTVWGVQGDFSAMGYVVDHLDLLIDEWFPGLNDQSISGEWLVRRLVLWEVPPELADKREGRGYMRGSVATEDCELVTFPLERCAAEALVHTTIACQEFNVRIPIHHLVPDLFLTDLPQHLKCDSRELLFDPADPVAFSDSVSLYYGKYRQKPVAIKTFLTAREAQYLKIAKPKVKVDGSEEVDELIMSGEALYMFRDLRQEVTIMAMLDHPNIVALLGVCIHPMSIILELAPLGTLSALLSAHIEHLNEIKTSGSLHMHGGVLGHVLLTRIALQIALALRYLHTQQVVYCDVKPDNILVWSVDESNPVNVKLADNGISKFSHPGGVRGEEGTAGYIAPEAILRRGEDQVFDEKVDIFSFAMLLFELLAGQRPFQSLKTSTELNQAVMQGKRPVVAEGNRNPAFPGMIDLMVDCWNQDAHERPSASEVVERILEPGFECCQHIITRAKDHPLHKVDAIFAPFSGDGQKRYQVWTWSHQDKERVFSVMDVQKGAHSLVEKKIPGGRVLAIAATEEQMWIGTTDYEIQVFGFTNTRDPQNLWTFQMKDSVISIKTETEEGKVTRVFASLANGTVAIFSQNKSLHSSNGCNDPSTEQNTGDAHFVPAPCTIKCRNEQYQQEADKWANPLILKLEEKGTPAKCMAFVGNHKLWCGCGNTIVVVDITAISILHRFHVFVRKTTLVNELVSNGCKVWGVGRDLSCVMEWDVKTYKLLHIFDCSKVDPTGRIVQSDPAAVEDVISVDFKEAKKSSKPVTLELRQYSRTDPFTVNNEPTPTSSRALFATTRTRKSLQTLKKKRHLSKKAAMAKHSQKHLSPIPERSFQRIQQSSSRTTSLLIVDKTLWVGRGMGDILVIDISKASTEHGKVLARLCMEKNENYGRRSQHKLQNVAGEYVVSSQWLEPLDVFQGRRVSGSGQLSLTGQLAHAHHFTHQAVTVWAAWSKAKILEFAKSCETMLQNELSCNGTV